MICHCEIDSASLCEMIMLRALQSYQAILVLSPTKKASIELRMQFAEVHKRSGLAATKSSAYCVRFENETHIWFHVATECVGRGLSSSMVVIDDSAKIKPKKLMLSIMPMLSSYKESVLVINTPKWG